MPTMHLGAQVRQSEGVCFKGRAPLHHMHMRFIPAGSGTTIPCRCAVAIGAHGACAWSYPPAPRDILMLHPRVDEVTTCLHA